MNKHHQYHRPIQIYHLHPSQTKQRKSTINRKEKNDKKQQVGTYPVAVLDMADEPEEHVNVEEEEGVG
jgi:hypothetical protein